MKFTLSPTAAALALLLMPALVPAQTICMPSQNRILQSGR